MRIVGFVVLVLFSFFINAQENAFLKINNTEYSLDYPSSWSKNEAKIEGFKFFLFTKLTSESDKFRDNINLIVQDLSGYDFSLEDYAELSETQIKTLVTNAHILESAQHKNENGVFYKMIYTGKQGVFDLKFEQYYWLVNKKAYVLTLTCEERQFLKFKKEGEFILDSFTIH